MTNLEWLEKIKKEDEPYDYDECGWPTPEWRIKFRQTKALEIIAEELIMLRAKPVVVNNVNFPNK